MALQSSSNTRKHVDKNEPRNEDNTKTVQDSSEAEAKSKDVSDTRLTLLKCLNTFPLFMLYLTGIGTFLALISEPLCMKTYFSDNSLLPGLVQRECPHSVDAEAYLKDMKALVSTDISTEQEQKSAKTNEYIANVLSSLGLKTHSQSFSYDQHKFHSKLSTMHQQNNQATNMEGTNLYTIIRSERSVTSETLVLCVPYRASGRKTTLPSVALALSLANYFASRNYWAKDLIILIADHNLYGISAWLDAYYDVRRSQNTNDTVQIGYDTLIARSGPILATINLELHASTLEHIDIQIEGLNGQLPNLDLFNLVVEMAARETITPMFYGHSMPFDLTNEQLYMLHLTTVLSMMQSQASMLAPSAHGLFQKFAIQSLTLEGYEFRSSASGQSLLPAHSLNVARLIEGIFRSLNNLVERFNRSYYFYLLTSVRRFISIGYYMVAFGLMTVPLLLKALRLHIKGSTLTHSSLWRAAQGCAHSQLHGILLFTLPSLVLYVTSRFDLSLATGQLTASQLISLMTITYSLVVPLTYLVMKSSGQYDNQEQHTFVLLIACLNLALYLSLISLINISLALFLSFVLVPIALTLEPPKSLLGYVVNRAVLILVHPLMLAIIAITMSSIVRESTQSNDIALHVLKSGEIAYETISRFAEQWYLFGNWAHLLLGPMMFPIWLQLWKVT